MAVRCRGVLAVLALLAVMPVCSPASATELRVRVTVNGEPLAAFHLVYEAVGGDIRAVTDAAGEAAFLLNEDPNPDRVREDDWNPVAADFRLRPIQIARPPFTYEAHRSALSAMDENPRQCDGLMIHDIMSSAHFLWTAEEYDQWYGTLSPETVSHCELLQAMSAAMVSPAPWYFYLFKGSPQTCEDERLLSEVSITTGYRNALEEAIGVAPGPCVSGFDRWWREQGYTAIPLPVHVSKADNAD